MRKYGAKGKATSSSSSSSSNDFKDYADAKQGIILAGKKYSTNYIF